MTVAEITFWGLFAVLAWAFAGYPALILLRASIRARRTPGGKLQTTVSVVLPVRNEAARIEQRIRNLSAQRYPAELVEIIVVCNGCTDATEQVVRTLAGTTPGLRLAVSPGADGKSGALNIGASLATGEIIVFADARQAFDSNALTHLVSAFGDPGVGAASGRLVIGRSRKPGVQGVNVYWQYETLLRIAEGRTGSTVGVTGAIYAIRRSLFTNLPPDLILDDVYVPMAIVAQRYRVVMVPEAVAFDTPASGAVSEYRRKLRTLSGNLQILRLAPWLLSPTRNPIFLRYVSHKLLRLVAPLCCLGMLAAGLVLTGVVYQAFVIGLLAAYVSGIIGLWVRLPVFAVPSAFVLVQVAGLAALIQPSRGAADVWR